LYARFKTLKENPENVWTLEDQPHGKHQTKEEGKLRRPRQRFVEDRALPMRSPLALALPYSRAWQGAAAE
jgi:hypothetical protein